MFLTFKRWEIFRMRCISFELKTNPKRDSHEIENFASNAEKKSGQFW